MLTRTLLSLSVVAAGLLCTPGTTQKVCFAENEAAPWDVLFSPVTSPEWVLVDATVLVPGTTSITGIELPLAIPTAVSGPALVKVGVFSAPNCLAPVAVGVVSVEPGGAPSWYHAQLVPPLPVTGGAGLQVGAMLDKNVHFVLSRSGSLVKPFWLVPPSTPLCQWVSIPSNGLSLPVRLYCGTHSGVSVEYGQGTPGGGGVPHLRAEGFPNTGNQVTLFTSHTSPGLIGGILLGTRGQLINPLLPVFVNPVALTLPIRTTSFGPQLGGYQLTPLDLPALASLNGANLAAQTVLLDPLATLGLSGTNGVEITIGH